MFVLPSTYGIDDPHDGYGPNRFRRLAAEGKDLVLFGEGEEQRDHVAVADIAELVLCIVLHRSTGIVNAVSGEVVSFRALAEFIAAQFTPLVTIKGSPRAARCRTTACGLSPPALHSRHFRDSNLLRGRKGLPRCARKQRKPKKMIGFVGLSHLGLNYSLATAAKGFDVVAYDPDPALTARCSRRRISHRGAGIRGAVRSTSRSHPLHVRSKPRWQNAILFFIRSTSP